MHLPFNYFVIGVEQRVQNDYLLGHCAMQSGKIIHDLMELNTIFCARSHISTM